MGGRLYFYSMRQPVADMLERGSFSAQIGPENIFHRRAEAIGSAFTHLDRSICARCSARIFNECAALPPAEQ
jgi:SulP family sulfate permease